MAIGRTNAGGGGTSLNFKVVGGTTQPTSPKENTIWVKTAIDIPAAYLNKGPSPTWVNSKGAVAISYEPIRGTGNITPTTPTLNLIKSGAGGISGIFAMLNACYQNQDGTKTGWEPMDAYIYKSGVWVQVDTGYIYRNGAFKDVTGLTCTRCYTGKTENNLTITTDGNVYANAYTAEMVDMTDASTVKIVLESGTKGYSASIGVMPTTPVQNASTGNISGYQARKVIKSGGFASFSDTYTLDVSAVTGKQYVVIEIAGSSSGDGHLIVSEISYL